MKSIKRNLLNNLLSQERWSSQHFVSQNPTDVDLLTPSSLLKVVGTVCRILAGPPAVGHYFQAHFHSRCWYPNLHLGNMNCYLQRNYLASNLPIHLRPYLQCFRVQTRNYETLHRSLPYTNENQKIRIKFRTLHICKLMFSR